jgi:hypothetical protein
MTKLASGHLFKKTTLQGMLISVGHLLIFLLLYILWPRP